MTARKSRTSLPLRLLALLGLVPLPAAAQSSLPVALGSYAQGIDFMTLVLLGISAFFFLLVTVLMVVFIVRYRARKKAGDGAAVHGNTKLEIIWTAIPFAIMVFLGIWAWGPIAEQLSPPRDALVVKVTGYAFDWDFEYFQTIDAAAGAAEGDADALAFDFICGNPANFVRVKALGVKTTHQLWLPKDRPVRFIITAKDVLHSFWIPEMRFKADAVPNYYSDGWMRPDHLTGDKPLIAKCAELCGADHAVMQALVHIVEPAAFDAWLSAEQLKQAKPAGAAAPAAQQ